MDEILTQIWLLVDCLNKKIESLEAIVAFTNKQTELITNAPNDNASFNDVVEKKKEYIDHVNDLDNIFANIYERVKDFLGKGNTAHREPLMEMQSRIKTVTELTIKIKTLEEKNARVITGGVRKPPKKLVTTNHAVSAYKKNKKF